MIDEPRATNATQATTPPGPLGWAAVGQLASANRNRTEPRSLSVEITRCELCRRGSALVRCTWKAAAMGVGEPTGTRWQKQGVATTGAAGSMFSDVQGAAVAAVFESTHAAAGARPRRGTRGPLMLKTLVATAVPTLC